MGVKGIKNLIKEPFAILSEIYSFGYDELVDNFRHGQDFIELHDYSTNHITYLYKPEFIDIISSLPIVYFQPFGYGEYISRIDGKDNGKHIKTFYDYLKEQRYIQGAHSKMICENEKKNEWITLYPGQTIYQFFKP